MYHGLNEAIVPAVLRSMSTHYECTPDYDFDTWMTESGLLRVLQPSVIWLLECQMCDHVTFYDKTVQAECVCCGTDLHGQHLNQFSLEDYWDMQLEDEKIVSEIFTRDKRYARSGDALTR